MPIRREIHMGWPLGQRSSEHLMQMPDGALLLARNCDIGADRSLRIRRPVKTIITPIEEDSLRQPIIGMQEYQNGSTKELIIAAGTKIYKWDATDILPSVTALTDATGFTADAQWSMVRWRDTTRNWMIMGQAGENTSYYNGTAVVSLGLSYTFVYLASWQGFLWGAEADSNFVRFSNISNPTSFLSTDAFALNDARGGSITMIGGHNDVLLYGGRNQMNIVLGRNRDTFQVYPLSSAHGCVAHETFQSTRIGAMWLDEDGVYLWNGETLDRLSRPIDDVFRAMDFTKLTSAVATYYRSPETRLHKYVLAISFERQRTNAYIVEYTLETDGWVVRTGDQALAFAVGHDDNDMDVLYAGTSDGVVMKWDQDRGDDTVVDLNLIDRPFGSSIPISEKVLSRLFIYYQADTSASVDLRITPDFNETPYTKSLDFIPDTEIPTQYRFDMTPAKKHFLQGARAREIVIGPIGSRGKFFNVQLQNRQNGRAFRILAIGAEFNVNADQLESTLVEVAA